MRWHRVPGEIDRELDPQGEIVTVKHAYRWFDRSLRNIHPRLRLAFDRKDGYWCIVRVDPEFRQLAGGLGHSQLIPNVLMQLKQGRMAKDSTVTWEARKPAERFLAKVAQQHGAWEADNGAWASRAIDKFGEQDEVEKNERLEEIAKGHTENFLSTCSKTNPDWDKTYHTVTEEVPT